MRVPFQASERASLGVEWELEIVDRRTRGLAQSAVEILEEIRPIGLEAHPKAKHELFQSTVEIITGICQDVDEAREDLTATLREVSAAADARGLGLICSGTHPFSPLEEQRVSPDPRYHDLVERLRWPARRMAIYGVHVHVGVTAESKIIPTLNALTRYIPHLLALTASSPYWTGVDTGLASCRSKVFEGLPTAGLPVRFEDWAAFETFVAAQIRAGSIETIREVWWDIRPHPNFGTVEVRAFDGVPTMDELMMVAALTQSLVQHLDNLLEAGETPPELPEWALRENKWRAARYGLNAEILVDASGAVSPLRTEIARTVEMLRPVAASLGCLRDLETVLVVLQTGASYQRQRSVVQNGGDLVAVVDSLLGEMAGGLSR